jgi:molybdate transport system substrate-binding protein
VNLRFKTICIELIFVGLMPGAVVEAQPSLVKPSVTWSADAVPSSSKIDLAKVFFTNSSGEKRFSTSGNCTVNGKSLFTNKVGKCRIQLSIASTQKYSAITSLKVIEVKNKVELNILAAASLSEAFEELRELFIARYLHVSIRFNFAGSSTLVTQIQQGALFDIAALADTVSMDRLVSSAEIDKSSVSILVRNRLAILVQSGNPQKIGDLVDLARAGLKVVLCDQSQPCGRYASEILAKAKIRVTPTSSESSASGVVSRIAFGEADAGIAYVTDGLIAGDKVEAIVIADLQNVLANYPIGVAAKPKSKDSAMINAFIATAKSKVGKKVFMTRGFMVS